ncbi:hypothetical protein C7447_103328 [Tenacibaculum adriaticum]|uniref:Uncharacterized protein n=1 Tax=Tenacibaculum adriaticum TaxID=413713 RepID=A0A5S5DRZ7_9FLAO|nr:hypothetical protein [Tenacibaculum adriaticum]TYP98158.1 hypothetical protein C7447_103328 [Tenacibaculum adriaticum]
MNSKFNNYQFETNIKSIYQIFWITYDLLIISPDVELNFNIEKPHSPLSIISSNLSFSQIQSIFIENQIQYNQIQHP